MSLSKKIISPTQLASRARRRKGKRFVFTNGCFDILHRGHVTYLERAKKKGDLLIVALNSDASVKRLKGKSRPVNPLKDRMMVIAALESVDFVTWFSADTPLRLIENIKPDVLVKGGDWKASQIVGSKQVLERGGKVFSLPFIKGKSTTSIIRRASSRK